MGIEINRLTAPTTILANGSSYRRISNAADDFSSPAPSPNFLRLNHLDRSLDNDDDDNEDSSTTDITSAGTTGETAGIYLGILNVFSTLPQFVGTFISMIVFSILEPGKSPELHKPHEGISVEEAALEEERKRKAEGPNAIAVCLFIGALSALGAAYATRRMKVGERRRRGVRKG